ncbi:MAG: ubiquitin-like domain-containing protein [Candidatus Promineifilaceae bacterium]
MNKLSLVGWLLIGSAIFVASLATWYWLGTEQYSVLVDGEVHSIRGNYGNINDVLIAAGVEVGPHDRVSPASSTTLETGGMIEIERARAIEVHTDDGSEVYWTHHTQLSPFLQGNSITIGPSYAITVGSDQLSYEAVESALLEDELFVSRFKTIVIEDDGVSQSMTTGAETVGVVLGEAGITLLNADTVEPDLDAWLRPDMQIKITRASPVIISVDGEYLSQRTNFTKTAKIIDEAGILMSELDYTIPGPDFEIVPGNIVRVVRVSEDFLLEDETFPYDALFQGTDLLDLDQRAIIVPGEPGILRRRIRVRYEDGVEVSRSADGEWVEKSAVDEVTGYGTNVVVRILETPEGSYEYWRVVRMRVTAYTASSSGKPPDHPAYGITASGVTAGTGVVAVDPSVVPFRSWVYVPGYGIGYAGDTGGGVKGRWIDLGYDEDELVAWSSYVDVYYLTPVPPSANITYVIPTGLP